MVQWLWRRLVATPPIRPLVWESPYATEAALEKAKKKKGSILLSHKKERNNAICNNMDATRDSHIK